MRPSQAAVLLSCLVGMFSSSVALGQARKPGGPGGKGLPAALPSFGGIPGAFSMRAVELRPFSAGVNISLPAPARGIAPAVRAASPYDLKRIAALASSPSVWGALLRHGPEAARASSHRDLETAQAASARNFSEVAGSGRLLFSDSAASPAGAPAPPSDPAPPDGGEKKIAYDLPGGRKLEITVLGQPDFPKPIPLDSAPIELLEKRYKVAIIGGGLTGLAAADLLQREFGKEQVVLFEAGDSAGGVAAQGKIAGGATYARGSAYLAKPEGRMRQIYRRLGLPTPKKIAIEHPIDSLVYKGRLIENPWSEEGLKRLPPPYRAFRDDLLALSKKGYLSFEFPEDISQEAKWLDRISAAEYVERYGPELKEFLDSYAQSAMGAKTDHISALAFLYFYLSEVQDRYAWPGGTGGATEHLVKRILRRNRGTIQTRTLVAEVRNTGDGVLVTYQQEGKLSSVQADYAVISVPLKAAARIVPEMTTEKREIVQKIQYANYVVHSIFTLRDFFTRSYDTWFTKYFFTDVITGNWVATEGFRKKPKGSGTGILTVYNPLAPHQKASTLSVQDVAEMARIAVLQLSEFIVELTRLPRIIMESFRWPSSIHVVHPGYLTEEAARFSEPDGNIHYAGSNNATPNFETTFLQAWRVTRELLKDARARQRARRGH